MALDILEIFLQLSFDKEKCLPALQSVDAKKFLIFKQVLKNPTPQVSAALENLMDNLKPVVQHVVHNEPSESQHVMLSYNWGVKPLVQRANEMLKRAGIKTWIDETDMKGNLNDSMADAVEGASHILVFVTKKCKSRILLLANTHER